METFPVTHFQFSTKYPQSGTRVQLGKSYQFDAPPKAPDQRMFVLTIMGLQYFTDSQGQLDLLVHPERNVAVLDQFYQDHKTAFPFLFNHPVYGEVTVKFSRPLEIPRGIIGGEGVVETFDVELLEIP